MKYCPKCETKKSKKEFHKNKARKDGLQSVCKICRVEYDRKYYKENKAYWIARNKKYRNSLYEWIKGIKKGGCTTCSESHWSCIDFHHVKGKKIDNIANMIKNLRSKNLIREEIKKCVLLCANCHRKVQAGIISLSTKKEKCYGNQN